LTTVGEGVSGEKRVWTRIVVFDGLGFFAVVPGVELDAGKAAYYSQFRVFRTAW